MRQRTFSEEQENGFRIGRGTIVDATLIAAPSSTKNQEQQRDPEMMRRRMLALASGQCVRNMANERTEARKDETNRPSSGENDPPVPA